MKFCILIPCYNHVATVVEVARAAQAHGPVLVVDDGSTLPLPEMPGCTIFRLGKNSGKAAALREGFRHAIELGFTHAITMDADGQHFASDLPKFIAALQAQPEALIVGVRNLREAGAPGHRQCSNAVSSFWFWAETGARLRDTQCGFRCYPLALTQKLQARSQRYAFELEFMVRSCWLSVPLVPVPVTCTYSPQQIRQSHFRPVVDLARITRMNVKLVLQSWFVPRTLRAAWSLGERKGFRQSAKEIFTDHAHQPGQLALAVGLGLFCGIAPIWGFQLLAAVSLAHIFRLNKIIAMLASHISIPPVMPLILFAGLEVGHRLFTGEWVNFSGQEITHEVVLQYLWQWVVGSFALAAAVAAAGTVLTYGIAQLVRKK